MQHDPHPAIHWPPGFAPGSVDSFVHHERRLALPREQVFPWLAGIADWPAWKPGVLRTELAGAVTVGSRFVVEAFQQALDGTVGELSAPDRFGWAGVGPGVSFYQSWLLLGEPGGTLAILEETARGPYALVRTTSRTELTRRWLEALPEVGR